MLKSIESNVQKRGQNFMIIFGNNLFSYFAVYQSITLIYLEIF
jgi:hypothetical protein